MKIKKNWKLWSLILGCFIIIWISRDSYLTYNLKVEHAKSNYELQIKKELSREGGKLKSIPPTIPPAPITIPKQPVDVWGLIVKAGIVLSGLKTLLDVADKFKSKLFSKVAKEVK